MPLGTGNQWNYEIVIQDDTGDQDTCSRHEEIIGTAQFEGKSYYRFKAIQMEAGTGDTSDVEGSYIRQEDQALYLYDDIDTTAADLDEYDRFYASLIMESRPWKLADFTSPAGQTWDVLHGQKRWNLEGGGTQSVTVKLTASNEGRTQVTVPAGT